MGAKDLIIRTGDALGLFAAGQALRKVPYVRVINYHATPQEHAANFRAQLEFYASYFANATPAVLDGALTGEGARPAIAISFDDGYRSNYDVAAPLLEEFGFTGWFFVSSGRVRGDDPQALAVCGEPARDFMSHAEMRDLIARGHVIGCHTHSHVRLEDKLNAETLTREIIDARIALQTSLDDPIDNFCWVGGEEWSYSTAAARTIVAAGYARAFMTNCQPVTTGTHPHALQRTNVEAHWPLSQVRFYLSGVMDIAYAAKHKRVLAKTVGAIDA